MPPTRACNALARAVSCNMIKGSTTVTRHRLSSGPSSWRLSYPVAATRVPRRRVPRSRSHGPQRRQYSLAKRRMYRTNGSFRSQSKCTRTAAATATRARAARHRTPRSHKHSHQDTALMHQRRGREAEARGGAVSVTQRRDRALRSERRSRHFFVLRVAQPFTPPCAAIRWGYSFSFALPPQIPPWPCIGPAG